MPTFKIDALFRTGEMNKMTVDEMEKHIQTMLYDVIGASGITGVTVWQTYPSGPG